LRVSFYTEFAACYEAVFPYRPATGAFLRARLPERGLVLDLGCGTGHHTGALAAAGLDVVGVDLDDAMIAAARERYPAARFVASDLADVAGVAGVSAGVPAYGAWCIGNVLPHLPADRLAPFLDSLTKVLAPGAPWIVQTVNFDRLLPLTAPHDFPPLTVDDRYVFHRRYEAADDAVRFVTALDRDGERVFTGHALLWPRRADEYAAIHADAGFALVEQCGGFDGAAFAPETSGGCVQVYRRTCA
jgi:SAM-dependent methyltransferase